MGGVYPDRLIASPIEAVTHHGFVTAINRCIEWELATVPILILCTVLLPRHAREPELQGAESDAAEGRDPAYAMAQ